MPVLLLLAFAVAADGSQARLLHRAPLDGGIAERHAAWSPDGSVFYYAHLLTGPHSTPVRARALVWRAGDERAFLATVASPEWVDQIAVLPEGNLLLWGRNDAWLLDRDGNARPFPNEGVRKIAREPDHSSQFVGLDNQGRAIITIMSRAGESLAALDLHTGALTAIYP